MNMDDTNLKCCENCTLWKKNDMIMLDNEPCGDCLYDDEVHGETDCCEYWTSVKGGK